MNEIEKAQQKSQEALLSASKIIFKASEAINKAFKDVRFASEELEARLSELSKPVEREYRAGEWVPGTYTRTSIPSLLVGWIALVFSAH